MCDFEKLDVFEKTQSYEHSFRNYTISKTFPKVEVLNFLIQERKYRVHTNEVEVVHVEKISKWYQ